MSTKVYLDHAATTPVDPEVVKAMQPYFSDIFGNPSSLHSFGQKAMRAVDLAREKIAKFLGGDFGEVIFTSGATEADNLAIRGVVSAKGYPEKKLHIVTSAIEHPAVLETCRYLEKNGVEVSYIKPQQDGVVQIEDIEKEIKQNTVLVSIMYVNNEIGTIQPIGEIGKMIKRINEQRENKIYFHTDAVQAVNYCPMGIQKLGVDLVSISGHKIYGPKGIGVLYVKKGTSLKPVQFGGHHEFGLRPGTLNTPLIVGLGKAVELIKNRDNNKIKIIRDYLWQRIQQKINGVKLNGSLDKRVPNNLNFSVEGVEGEALLLGLDLKNIAVSTGSACSSGSLEPSHVLMSIGLSHEQSHGSLRVTLGKDNTQQEMDYFVDALAPLVDKFRKIAPDWK